MMRYTNWRPLPFFTIKRSGFGLRSGCCQVVTSWMGDCLLAGKPSSYITNTKINSALHFSGVWGKLSFELLNLSAFTHFMWQKTL